MSSENKKVMHKMWLKFKNLLLSLIICVLYLCICVLFLRKGKFRDAENDIALVSMRLNRNECPVLLNGSDMRTHMAGCTQRASHQPLHIPMARREGIMAELTFGSIIKDSLCMHLCFSKLREYLAPQFKVHHVIYRKRYCPSVKQKTNEHSSTQAYFPKLSHFSIKAKENYDLYYQYTDMLNFRKIKLSISKLNEKKMKLNHHAWNFN